MQPSATARGTTRLERTAEATTWQVDDLLAELREGRLRMPPFQRGMKWQDEDRIDLFDSLYRGFPIGTLLVWRHHLDPGEVRFGDLAFEARGRQDGFLIVDGQQRVTTLASALLVPRAAGERTILFDLETEEFRYGRAREDTPSGFPGAAPQASDIPVHELFDSSRLIQWLARRTRGLPPAIIDRALECGKRLRQYRVPVNIVNTADEDVVLTIFDRTNRTGRRLDDADVFTALFATIRPQDESAEVSLERVARRVAQLGFGTLGAGTVLKALRAVCDLPLGKDFTKALVRQDAPAALERTEAALMRAVRFLREDAQIPHAALCPYELPIVVLSRFFDAFPQPRRRNRALLRRWLWRGSLAASLRGATSSLRQHVNAITKDESTSVQALLRLSAPSEPPTDLSFDPFSFATAKSKLAVCALASFGPRDLRTGEPLDVAAMFQGPSPSHSSPSLPIIVKHHENDETGRSVANRLLHPRLSPVELIKALARAAPEIAVSHAITSDAQSALRSREYDKFLELRRRRLSELSSVFFRKEAEIGADDSPPLDTIVVEEDPS
jgi:hypothetical protein